MVTLEMKTRERHSTGQLTPLPLGTLPNGMVSPTTSTTTLTGNMTTLILLGKFHLLFTGVWKERASLFLPPGDEDDTSELLPTAQTTPTSATPPQTVITPVSATPPQTITSQSSDTSSINYRGQPLQGAWGKSGITGAAMIKKSLDVTPGSTSSPTPINRVNSGPCRTPSNPNFFSTEKPHRGQSHGNSDHGNKEWKRQQSRDNWSKQRYSDSQTRSRGPRVGRGYEEGGRYLRSVSDISYATSTGQGRGRRRGQSNPSHSSSEPVGNRTRYQKNNGK